MAVREPLGHLLGRESPAVVLDDELDRPVPFLESERQLRGLRMPDDVREELTRRGEEQLLLRVPPLAVELEVEPKVSAHRRLLGERAQRGLEARLLEDVRVQVEDGVAQLPDGVEQRRVGPFERRMGLRLLRLLELVANREQVLDRMVVERLRERLALSLLGLERVREQARALVRQALDQLRAAREKQGKKDACDTDPREEPRLRDDEADGLRAAARAGWSDGLDHVRRRRDDDRGRGQRRAQAEGDRHRHDEEREPARARTLLPTGSPGR